MTGFIESGYDPRDLEYIPTEDIHTEELPEYFDYTEFLDLVIKDQGQTNTCVPHAISTMVEGREELYARNYDIFGTYNRRSNKPEEGMTIRNALQLLRKDTNDRRITFFRLRSWQQMKWSLIANGPCVLALPVRSMGSKFWRGSDYYGGHAVACVGYDDEGFIIQNSWGSDWGSCGKTKLLYEDVNFIIEAWGIS